MNFYKIIFNRGKTIKNKMPKCFLQAVKLTLSRKEYKVLFSYDKCLRFRNSGGDYKIM